MNDISIKLRRLELLVEYANKLVGERGVKELTKLGTLDWNIDKSYFKSLLRARQIFANFKGDKGVSFHERSMLYKRINGTCHYITLLEPLEDDFIYPDCELYSSKHDLNECSAIRELKRMVRKMIKDPDCYYRASSY